MEWECPNVRWAPSAQLFAKALAAVEAKLLAESAAANAPPSQVKKAKEREFLRHFPFKVPPKLSWPPPEEVYEYRSFSEAAQILRINSAAEFEISGKRVSEERLKEIKERVYEMDKVKDKVQESAVAPRVEAWRYFYGPEALEDSLRHDLENGRTRKEFVENKKEALLAKLKNRCT